MKNRSLVTCLRQFNPKLKVSIKATLQYGCYEKGSGGGEYEGYSFSQDYTTGWNDGYLEAKEYDGYTVEDVIRVLLEKPLSKIGDKDFALNLGELSNGNTDYETTWDDGEPEDLPEDSELYWKMDIGDAEYEWSGAEYIEFEVHYVEQDGSDNYLSFVLSEDEVDRKPDPLDEKKNKPAPKKKAAKKK